MLPNIYRRYILSTCLLTAASSLFSISFGQEPASSRQLITINSASTENQQNWPVDSWPQWGGVDRNYQSQATGLLQEWPEAGPKLSWSFKDAGIGYSSFAILDGRLYTLGLSEDKNFALCLDSKSGEELWRRNLSAAVPNEKYLQGWGAGPRSTPTLVGNKLLALDDGGTLSCIERLTGDLLWSISLIDDLGGDLPKWGYSESPLVDGNRVIVCPGKQNYLVALDLETGKTVMTSSGFSEPAHYVSVIKHEVRGVPMYITATQTGLVGFSATTGEKLWTNNSSGNNVATITTPIADGDLIYHTSAYSTGCALVEISGGANSITATEKYFNKNMQNHHGGVVLVDGKIYGFRKGGGWVCQDFLTGELDWNERLSGDGSASVAFADNRIYVYGENSGTCYLVEPSSEQWLERGKLTLPAQTEIDRKQGKIWAQPVIAEGKLFLRDLDLIYAFDISAE